MIDIFLVLTVLGLATSTIAVTVGQSKIFKPLRLWIDDRSDFFGSLISCPYCLGHWVAAYILAYWNTFMHNPPYTGFVGLSQLVLFWLAITNIAALSSGCVNKLFISGDHDGGD